MPPRFRPAEFHDGGFTHCKIMYTSVRREANGMGWATDYPFAGINLLTRVGELTKTRVSVDDAGRPQLLGGAAHRRRPVQLPVHDGHRRRHAGVLGRGSGAAAQPIC